MRWGRREISLIQGHRVEEMVWRIGRWEIWKDRKRNGKGRVMKGEIRDWVFEIQLNVLSTLSESFKKPLIEKTAVRGDCWCWLLFIDLCLFVDNWNCYIVIRQIQLQRNLFSKHPQIPRTQQQQYSNGQGATNSTLWQLCKGDWGHMGML